MTDTRGFPASGTGAGAGLGTGTNTGNTGASSGSGSEGSTRDVAKDEARSVAQDAAQSGRATAETAKQQAGQVAGEASAQARQLLDQAREEITGQGAAQKERATSGLRSLADELNGMVQGGGTQPEGLAGDLARQASERVRSAADWLETHEPGDVLQEVRRFARQRPGAFLLSAAAVGFLGGRLTRGLADEAKDYADAEQNGGSATGRHAAPAPAAPLSAGHGTGIGSTDPFDTGVSDADPVRAATERQGLGDDLPQEAPGTPGYGIPPAGDDQRGVEGTGPQGSRF